MNDKTKEEALKIAESIRAGDRVVMPASVTTSQRLYTISEVAAELGRVPHTLRVWGYDNRIPEHLKPTRTARGWRVWTREQIEGLKVWIVEEDLTPGKGLRNYGKK